MKLTKDFFNGDKGVLRLLLVVLFIITSLDRFVFAIILLLFIFSLNKITKTKLWLLVIYSGIVTFINVVLYSSNYYNNPSILTTYLGIKPAIIYVIIYIAIIYFIIKEYKSIKLNSKNNTNSNPTNISDLLNQPIIKNNNIIFNTIVKFVKKNYKILLTALLIVGSFYWWGFRPSQIKSECAEWALIRAKAMENGYLDSFYEQNPDTNVAEVTKYLSEKYKTDSTLRLSTYDEKQYDDAYSRCLHEHGM